MSSESITWTLRWIRLLHEMNFRTSVFYINFRIPYSNNKNNKYKSKDLLLLSFSLQQEDRGWGRTTTLINVFKSQGVVHMQSKREYLVLARYVKMVWGLEFQYTLILVSNICRSMYHMICMIVYCHFIVKFYFNFVCLCAGWFIWACFNNILFSCTSISCISSVIVLVFLVWSMTNTHTRTQTNIHRYLKALTPYSNVAVWRRLYTHSLLEILDKKKDMKTKTN